MSILKGILEMKKFSIILLLILIFFIIFFLQANIFQILTIGGIMPNLFVIFILFIGLYSNTAMGVSFGVFCGLLIDLVYSKNIGITAIMLCIIGYLGAYFDKNFSKENKLTIIIIGAIATIIYEVGYYVLNAIILQFDMEIMYFIKILFVELLYNTLITIIIYPIIQKAGYAIDRNFKKDNILTRYF